MRLWRAKEPTALPEVRLRARGQKQSHDATARSVALGNLKRRNRPGSVKQLKIAIDQKRDLARHGLKRWNCVICA